MSVAMGQQLKVNTVVFKKDYCIIFIKQKKKVFRVFVDLEDYDKVRYHSWSYDGYGYAQARKNKKVIRMHKLILPQESFVDHINHNGFDNRKINLRYVTAYQNAQNMKSISRVGKYKDKWRARICINGEQKTLGLFNTAKEAWKARYRAQRVYFQ